MSVARPISPIQLDSIQRWEIPAWAASAMGRWAQHLAAGCLAMLIGVLALVWFTRNNNFPVAYHPDEVDKAAQILDRQERRNFNHPLLLLESTEHMAQWWHATDIRSVVVTGRITSAVLASIGVTAAALAGYVMYGFAGLLISGLTLAFCPPLLVYAHFLKEDAALAGAILFTLGAAALLLKSSRPGTRALTIMLLGVGCGLTCSAKYFGMVIVVPALIALLLAKGWRWYSLPLRVLPFLLCGVVTAVVINQRAFDDCWTLTLRPEALDSMERETEHGISEHSGLTMTTPHTFFLRVAGEEWMPQVQLLGSLGLVIALTWHGFSRWGISLAVFCATFVIALAYCPIPFGRYALPISVCLYFLSAQAMASAVLLLLQSGRARLWVTGLLLLSIVILQGWRCAKFNYQFRHDSRQELLEWAAKNIPANAPVVADVYAVARRGDPWRFPEAKFPPVNWQTRTHAADFGSLAEIRRRGIRYVVVCEMTYERFLQPESVSAPEAGDFVERNRRFYETLFREGKLLKQFSPDPPSHAYVSPEIRVYEISN